MDWKTVGKSFLNAGLPILGTIFGGPLGGIAGKTAAALISSKLGIDEEDLTPDKYMEILGNPDMLAKLKEIELNHDLALETLVYEDRKSARQREVAITQATGTRDINLYIMAWILFAGFFGLLAILMFHSLPADQSGVVYMLFGSLATGFGSVVTYFFGSSKSSKEKTELLAQK